MPWNGGVKNFDANYPYCLNASLSSGTSTNGTWKCTLTVPASHSGDDLQAWYYVKDNFENSVEGGVIRIVLNDD